MSTVSVEIKSPRRRRIFDGLEQLENKLRDLAAADRENSWYATIGDILTNANWLFHDLGTIGFLDEARELYDLRNRVLESVGPLVMPNMCKDSPPEIREWTENRGIAVNPTPEEIEIATDKFVACLAEMADRTNRVRSYIANLEEVIECSKKIVAEQSASRRASIPCNPNDPIEVAKRARQVAKYAKNAQHLIHYLAVTEPWLDLDAARELLNPLAINIVLCPSLNSSSGIGHPPMQRKSLGKFTRSRTQ